MQETSEVLEQPSTRRCIIVFDIDDTLCHSPFREDYFRKNHPDCPIIEYKERIGYLETTHSYPHVFLPHLQILFDYLMEQGARIVFFSAAPKERNISVIPELLTSFWGSEKYEVLKSVGQFAIFSENDLRQGSGEGEGCRVKDLSVVIRDGESILDAILLDDNDSFCAHGQRPVMRIIDLMRWRTYHGEELDEEKTNGHLNFYKNGTYYMLGLLKSYYENEKYKQLPIREGIDQIVRAETDEFYRPEKLSKNREAHPFTLKMIGVGVAEVQKNLPNASIFSWTREIY